MNDLRQIQYLVLDIKYERDRTNLRQQKYNLEILSVKPVNPYNANTKGRDQPDHNKEIKHDFPFINIRKVPREVLQTEGKAQGFQPSQGTLQMLMNGKSC